MTNRTLASDTRAAWHYIWPWLATLATFTALGALTALIERM